MESSVASLPCGLDSDLFFFMLCGESSCSSPCSSSNHNNNNNSGSDSSDSDNNNNDDDEPTKAKKNKSGCLLSQALVMWAKQSEELGYSLEAEAIHIMATDVEKANITLATKSARANQMSRDVCRKSMSVQVMEELTPLLFCGCCSEIYHRLLSILQHLKGRNAHNYYCQASSHNNPNKNDEDLFHITHIISFLDSDREFNDVLSAHKIIEDAYKALNIFIPRLRQLHAAERLGEVLQTDEVLVLPVSEMPHYHNHPCGPCSFQYLMTRL